MTSRWVFRVLCVIALEVAILAGIVWLRAFQADPSTWTTVDEFAAPGAPQVDFVFTVCDDAADEACPVWPGHPVTAHWGLPDPSAVQGTEAGKRLAFADTHRMLSQRIDAFVHLPFASLDRMALERRLARIGALRGEPVVADR